VHKREIIVMIYLVILVAFSLLMLYVGVKWVKNMYHLRHFRGPTPLPLVGNMNSPGVLSIIKHWATLRRQYGPFYTFFAWTHAYLVVCEPAAVRQILTDHKSFPKGDAYSSGFAYVFGQGLVTSKAEKHKQDRSRFSKYFVGTNVEHYLTMINAKTLEGYEEMRHEAGDKKTFVYDMEHLFAPLTMRIFSTFCTGIDLYEGRRDLEKKVCKIVSDGSFYAALVMLLNLPQWKGVYPWTKSLDLIRDTMRPEIMHIVDTKRMALKNGTCSSPDDCVSQMIQDEIPEDELFDHMVTLLCAGHDTTAFFSSYMCFALAQHHDVQEKAYAEIQEVMGDRTEVTPDDIKTMVYLRKVMLETLRVYAIIPCLVRYSDEEFELKELNVTIPKGTNIMIPMSVVNRDPIAWPDPTKFDPERFEGTEKSVAKKGFFPFGYGSRVCIGNTLAQMESSVFMVHLLRKYKLTEDPTFRIKINAGISLTSSNGIRVTMTQR
jgi:cytochrome P450